MKDVQHYNDWKKEIQVWVVMNSVLKVDNKIQSGILFESLQGTTKKVVLSELSASEIINENGVQNIINILDQFFLGNEIQNGYQAIDELMQYKCGENSPVTTFLMEFQVKVNRVKASGTVLSEGLLGYMLLRAANLSEHKNNLIKATCVELSYQNVKTQLKKIGLMKSQAENRLLTKDKSLSPGAKYENGVSARTVPSYYSCKGNSNRIVEEDKIYCTSKRSSYLDQVVKKKPNLNSSDHFVHVKPFTVQKNQSKYSQLWNTSKNSYYVTFYTSCSNSDDLQVNVLSRETIGHAVVDTGSPCTVAGNEWLNSYLSSLSCKDRLSIRRKQSTNKFCFGDGKTHCSEHRILIPIYIGKLRHQLFVDIVRCNIPLLLSRKTLQCAKVKIDVQMATMCFQGSTIPLITSSTGHLCVQISRPLDFSNQESQKVLSRVLSYSEGNCRRLSTKEKALKLHLQFCHPTERDLIGFLKKTDSADSRLYDAVRQVTLECSMCQKIGNIQLSNTADESSNNDDNEDEYDTADEGDYYLSNDCVTSNKYDRCDNNIKEFDGDIIVGSCKPSKTTLCNYTYDPPLCCQKQEVFLFRPINNTSDSCD